jgi:hypothetical protein
MTIEDIQRIYREAAEISHLEGLVAVFEAGVKAQKDNPETAPVSNG